MRSLYTTDQVAQILNVDPESVRRYARSGELKSVLLGNKFIRIDGEDLQNFIQQRKFAVNYEHSNVGGVKPGSIWHSPPNVYWHIQEETKKVGQETIENSGKYEKLREARVAAVAALVMFKLTNKPAYVQLYKPDPPDALVMQRSLQVKGQQDISQIEITTYPGNKGESLIQQLKRTKVPPGVHLFSENYILVVNLFKGVTVNFEEINKYLVENKTPFPIWSIQEVESRPDTVAELVIINPEVYKIRVNIGEAVHIFNKFGLPGVIRTKRVGSTDLVRMEKAEKTYITPWDDFKTKSK